MPAPDWFDEYHLPLLLAPADSDQSRDTKLPGAVASACQSKFGQIECFHWESGLYQLGLRRLQFTKTKVLQVREFQPGFRFEAVLTGELHVINGEGIVTTITQGQYYIGTGTPYQVKVSKNAKVEYVVAYYTPQMLEHFGIDDGLDLFTPRYLPDNTRNIIQEALRNHYQGSLQGFYYRNLVSDLLFSHLSKGDEEYSTELTESDVAAVRKADSILSADLSMHYKIPELCVMTGTNEYKLKRGFRLIFKMGIFARLLNKRMDYAKLLLTTTSKPIKEIAYECGYDSHAGFITSFRKRYGKTPLEWRNEFK